MSKSFAQCLENKLTHYEEDNFREQLNRSDFDA